MSDRFRDLEELGNPGRKDAVLLATVSSFEAMDRPTRHDLHQFSLLFTPLFETASPEARRMAAASLSRSACVPPAISRAIVEQPIDVAAPYIVNAAGIDDALLIDVLRRRGGGHARAIARRNDLSATVVAALRSLDEPSVERSLTVRNRITPKPVDRRPDAAPKPGETRADMDTAIDTAGRTREDTIRNKLRTIAMRRSSESIPAAASPPSRIDPLVEERLMRHAQAGEPLYFATALADGLGSGFDLAERIMLDVSGRQLAETLVALGLRYTLIIVALERFFPHLAEGSGPSRRSLRLLRSCSFVDCVDRVTAWLRADLVTRRRAVHEPLTVDLEAPQHRRTAPASDARDNGFDRRRNGGLRRA